jgi:hypothetical protein
MCSDAARIRDIARSKIDMIPAARTTPDEDLGIAVLFYPS